MNKEIIGRVIGQCKNCYYFGVVKNAKIITYHGKNKNCHNLDEVNWGITNNHDKPDFGCWNWKPRKSKKKIVISIKIKHGDFK